MKLEELQNKINENTTDGSINYHEVTDFVNQEINSLLAKEKEKRKGIVSHEEFLKGKGFETVEAFESFMDGSKTAADELTTTKASYDELNTKYEELNTNYGNLNTTFKEQKLKATAMTVGVKGESVNDFLKLLDEVEDDKIESEMKAKLEKYPTFSNVQDFGKKSGKKSGNGGQSTSPFASMLESRKIK